VYLKVSPFFFGLLSFSLYLEFFSSSPLLSFESSLDASLIPFFIAYNFYAAAAALFLNDATRRRRRISMPLHAARVILYFIVEYYSN
jgi:hypothetical protein